MKIEDIASLRLHNQQLIDHSFETPAQIVSWLGAVQAQDYTGGKWAVGQRMLHSSDALLDEAFNAGHILRTHVMRPTWHFVCPEDIRWMLALTSPRVQAVSAYYFRKLGLDQAAFEKSNTILIKALKGNKHLTRDELKNIFEKEGFNVKNTNDLLRMNYILIYGELEGIICSGPKKGKQFTYALLDERVPHAKKLTHAEALVTLTLRYFRSHGPATLKDYAWWSGLTMSDVKNGIELTKIELQSEIIDDIEYWFSKSQKVLKKISLTVHLLSNYDEYGIAYKNHDAIFEKSYRQELQLLYPHAICINGLIVGAWKRAFKKKAVIISTKFFRSITKAEQEALAETAQQYGIFLNMAVILQNHPTINCEIR